MELTRPCKSIPKLTSIRATMSEQNPTSRLGDYQHQATPALIKEWMSNLQAMPCITFNRMMPSLVQSFSSPAEHDPSLHV